jgi:hypothetical protein
MVSSLYYPDGCTTFKMVIDTLTQELRFKELIHTKDVSFENGVGAREIFGKFGNL